MKFYNRFIALVVASSCFVNNSIQVQAMLSSDQHHQQQVSPDHHRELLVQTASASQVSRMQIDGWWASCGRLSKKCQGGFKEYGPERIDPTGNTCYINPLRRNLGVVQWIAPLGNETTAATTKTSNNDQATYVYAVTFPANLSDTYFPTNCTEAGACSCDTIEPLRAGWKENPQACGADAISCHIFPTYLEPGRDCNVNAYITYTDPNDGTQSFCSWTVSLAATSAAAAVATSMTGSLVLASLLLVWSLVM